MALAPPPTIYPPLSPMSSTGESNLSSNANAGPSHTSKSSGAQSQARPPLHLSTSYADESTPVQPIPAFLQSILSAHPAPPTPIDTPSTPNPYASSAALYTLPQAPPPPEDPLIPPENFSLVASGVYRSGFPKKRNFKFMETLRLKTVLTLVLEDYPETNLRWCEERDVQFMQFGIPGNKEPFDNIPEDVICSALVAILDKRNHPILIHCNKGKHRTGCLIGCIRRLQAWSLTSIFDEYRRFSTPKSRAVDQQFIDLFDISSVWDQVLSTGGGIENLPEWGMLTIPRRKEITAEIRDTRRSSLAGL